VLPGIIGVVQATEAIKLLLGIGDPLIGRLLTYDALGMRFREVKLRRDPKCPLCGEHPTITDLSIHRSAVDACATTDNGSSGGHPAAAGAAAAKGNG
jgi:bacteriocin biosynthesis cyclodehydratase domain-containing protein